MKKIFTLCLSMMMGCMVASAQAPADEVFQFTDSKGTVIKDGSNITSKEIHVIDYGMGDEYLEGCFTASSEGRYLEDAEFVLRHLDPAIIIQRLICETPYHRLLAPRVFPDKSLFLSRLDERMEEHGTMQGDLYES